MTLRHRLKSRTDDLHEELDALLGSFDLAAAGNYRTFLQVHARIVPPVEQALEQGGIAQILPDWESHRRTPLLEKDLAALGVSFPAPLSVPPLKGPPALLGTAYVIEGSRLGSRFLAKRVGDAMPANYLNAAGQQKAWPALLSALDRSDLGAPEQERAVDAARACFAMFLSATREALTHG